MPIPSRILFLHDITDLSGGEILLRDIILGLPADQFKAIVVLPHEGILPQTLRDKGVDVRLVDFLWHGPIDKLTKLITTVFTLRHMIQREHVALIHANDFRPALLAGLAAMGTKARVVWMVHGTWYTPNRFPTKLLLRHLVARFICVSDAVHRLFQNFPPAQSILTHPGVDTDYFQPTPQPEQKGTAIRLLCIGRFNPSKGFHLLLAAMETLLQQQLDVKLTLIGSRFDNETAAYEQQIRAQIAASKQLQRHVTLAPPTPDIKAVYQTHDILVSAATHEPFGLTLIEAMACGLPVVAARSGGPEEIVVQDQSGLLVEPNNPNALAVALLQLVLNPEQRLRFGLAGRARVIDHFRQQCFIQNMINIYQDLLPKN